MENFRRSKNAQGKEAFRPAPAASARPREYPPIADDTDNCDSWSEMWDDNDDLRNSFTVSGHRDDTANSHSSSMFSESSGSGISDDRDSIDIRDNVEISDVNPATGLPMTGDIDCGGNPYGTGDDTYIWNDSGSESSTFNWNDD